MSRGTVVYVRAMLIALVSVALIMGCQPRNVKTPDVVGMTRAAAEAAIRDAGLTVGAVTHEFNDDAPAGEVIRQTPEAGATVPRGSAVDLVLSRGPDDGTTPDPDPEGEAPGEGEVPDEGEAPGEGEIPGEGEPDEGEAPGEGEIPGEGEPGEGEAPGEGEIPGEGEPVEGEVEGEDEGEAEEEPAPEAEPPTANFSVDPVSGPWPLTVSFEDHSEPGDAPIASWLWDFGDGNLRLDQHATHVYREPGVFSVSLTVITDAGEDTFTAVNHVTVEDAVDTDGDGIPDWLELELGTDPNKWDTSGDGMSDGALYYAGKDPLEAHGAPAPETVILESHPELRLIEVGEDYLVFEAPPDKMDLLEPGRILVNASFEYAYVNKNGFLEWGVGFICRSAGAVVEGTRAVVSTVKGAIQDAWPELEFEGDVRLTLDSAGTNLHPYLNNYPLLSYGGLTVTSRDGRILLTPTLSLRLFIQGGEVKEFSTKLSGMMLLQQAADIGTSTGFTLNEDIPLAEVPIPIGNLPLLLTLSAEMGINLSMHGEATVYAGFRSQTHIEVGARYFNGVMSSYSGLDMGREFIGPELNVSAELDATVRLKPKVDISLYGRAGAYAQLRPFLNFNARFPCPPAPKLDAGIDAQVGIYADLFLWDWTPDPLTLLEVRRTLWEGGCWDLVVDPTQTRTPVIAPYTNTGWASYVISLSSATPGATIRYTLNGAEPTEASPVYIRPFIIQGEPGEEITVKARAWKDGLTPSAVSTRTYTFGETGAGEEHIVMLPGGVPLVLVRIPAGTYMRGCYPGEQDANTDREEPQHQVTLTQDFFMGKYVVTKGQWQAVMGTTPWSGQSYVLDDPDSPAVYVSWDDAQDFITALNAHITDTGQGAATVRLPSEAEWEYAARAGTTTRFYWGDDPGYTQIGDYAWYRDNAYDLGNRYAHVVGLKLPNPWGLYDMSGNVWEWCQDWYGGYPSGSVTDPTGPATGSYRVDRGGGWYGHPGGCRSAHRNGSAPGNRYDLLGFRLAWPAVQ